MGKDEKAARFVTTLGFWLWVGGAKLVPPGSWNGQYQEIANQTALPPLTWTDRGEVYCNVTDDHDIDFEEYNANAPLEQDLSVNPIQRVRKKHIQLHRTGCSVVACG